MSTIFTVLNNNSKGVGFQRGQSAHISSSTKIIVIQIIIGVWSGSYQLFHKTVVKINLLLKLGK